MKLIIKIVFSAGGYLWDSRWDNVANDWENGFDGFIESS